MAADPGLLRRDFFWLTVMGRLAPNLTLRSADTRIGALSRGLFEAVTPEGYDAAAMDTWRAFRLTAVPAPAGISDLRLEFETSLWVLLVIAAMVWLIACSNLANLLLAQAKARETEIAVKIALGVGRSRLAMQLMTESLVLAVLGTAAGSLLGSVLSAALASLLGTSRDPVQLDLSGDWRTLLFAASLATFTCLLLGISPLLRLVKTDIATAIHSAGRGGSQTAGQLRFQRVLIASQLTLSLFLLVACLSFVRSFRSLVTLDTGFRQDGLIFCFADFSRLRFNPARTRSFRTDLLETVRRAPGVQCASASTHVPLSGNSWTLGVKVPGREEEGSARFTWVSDDYVRTLGIPMVAGRNFSVHDVATAMRVILVNETFARQFCRASGAVGARIRSVAEPGYPATAYEIVGVLRDTR